MFFVRTCVSGFLSGHLDIMMNKVIKTFLEAMEDKMKRTDAELDQLAHETNVLYGTRTHVLTKGRRKRKARNLL